MVFSLLIKAALEPNAEVTSILFAPTQANMIVRFAKVKYVSPDDLSQKPAYTSLITSWKMKNNCTVLNMDFKSLQIYYLFSIYLATFICTS